MANRNQKRIAVLARKEIAANKRLNPDSRHQNPPRLNNKKDIESYKSFPGYRKPVREKVSR